MVEKRFSRSGLLRSSINDRKSTLVTALYNSDEAGSEGDADVDVAAAAAQPSQQESELQNRNKVKEMVGKILTQSTPFSRIGQRESQRGNNAENVRVFPITVMTDREFSNITKIPSAMGTSNVTHPLVEQQGTLDLSRAVSGAEGSTAPSTAPGRLLSTPLASNQSSTKPQFTVSKKDPKMVLTAEGEALPIEKMKTFWKNDKVTALLGDFVDSRYLSDGSKSKSDAKMITKEDLIKEDQNRDHIVDPVQQAEEQDRAIKRQWRKMCSAFKTISRETQSSHMRQHSKPIDVPNVGHYHPRYTIVDPREAADYLYRPKTTPADKLRSREAEQLSQSLRSFKMVSPAPVQQQTQQSEENKQTSPMRKKFKHGSYGLITDGKITSTKAYDAWHKTHHHTEDPKKAEELTKDFFFRTMTRDQRNSIDPTQNKAATAKLEIGHYWPLSDPNQFETRKSALVEIDRTVDRENLRGNHFAKADTHGNDLVYDTNMTTTARYDNLGLGKHQFESFCSRDQEQKTSRTGIELNNVQTASTKSRYPAFDRFIDTNRAPVEPRTQVVMDFQKQLNRDAKRPLHPKVTDMTFLKPKKDVDASDGVRAQQDSDGFLNGNIEASSRIERTTEPVDMRKQTGHNAPSTNQISDLLYDTSAYEQVRYEKQGPIPDMYKQTARPGKAKLVTDDLPFYDAKRSLTTLREKQPDFSRSPGRDKHKSTVMVRAGMVAGSKEEQELKSRQVFFDTLKVHKSLETPAYKLRAGTTIGKQLSRDQREKTLDPSLSLAAGQRKYYVGLEAAKKIDHHAKRDPAIYGPVVNYSVGGAARDGAATTGLP